MPIVFISITSCCRFFSILSRLSKSPNDSKPNPEAEHYRSAFFVSLTNLEKYAIIDLSSQIGVMSILKVRLDAFFREGNFMKLNKANTTQTNFALAEGHVKPCTKLQTDNIVFPSWKELGLLGKVLCQKIKTKEQPQGCDYDEATYQIVMRVINGKVLMTGGRPDAYTWKQSKVAKFAISAPAVPRLWSIWRNFLLPSLTPMNRICLRICSPNITAISC